jgi:hypothetical protein
MYNNKFIFLRRIIREQINNLYSKFISKSEDYGSFEGIIHSDLEKIKNWFLNRNIDYKKYIDKLELPTAFLNNINVEKKFRGKGCGNKLYSDFEEECYFNDAKCIILESDSGENQIKGFNLDSWYESLDFEIIGNGGENYIMLKILS